MNSRLSIKYFFNTYNENQPNIIHCIPEKDIIELLESHNYFVNIDLIQELLIKDHAIFDENSIRIYDENYKGYFLLTSDFVLEIDEKDPYLSLMLCLQPKLTDNYILNRINTMEEKYDHEIKSVKEEIRMIRGVQKALMKQMSKFFSNANLNDKDLEKSYGNLILPSNACKYIQDDNIKSDTNNNNNNNQTIDLAVMFAEPLVFEDPILGIRGMGDPVDYEEECVKLLENLRKKKKKIELVFELATSDSLLGILEKGPTILHIICHGEYSKEQNDFYLAFEQNGKLHPMYSQNLQEILEKIKPKIKLVFVNACHSELIAGVFQKIGVPCVIAIQSELKIEDVVAQHFACTFYDKLFDGKSIQESYELAQLSTKNRFSVNIKTCCCSHSHKPGCKWYQFALNEGFYKAHLIHVPTCEECKQRFQNIHLNNCPWAINFLAYQMDDLPDPDFIDPLKYRYTCCCSPELQHDESLKFKKLCETDADKLVLFPSKEAGEMKKLQVFNAINRKFHVKKVTGRNLEMYELFTLLTDRNFRFIELYGIEGIGKTTLIKQVANYLYERGYFQDNIIILTLDKTNSMTTFLAQLFKYFPAYDLEGFCHLIKYSKILFILEKCWTLCTRFPKEFKETLEYIINNTIYVNFMFVLNTKLKLGLDEKYVELQELDNNAAAKLLLKYAFSSLEFHNRNIFDLESHPIFNCIPKTPQHIWYIAEKLKEEYFCNLDKLAIDIQKSSTLANNIAGSQVIGSALKMLKEKRKKVYELLLMICTFPAGLTGYDLQLMKELGKLTISWHDTIQELTKKEVEVHELEQIINSYNEDMQHSTNQANQTEQKNFIPNNYFWVTVDKLKNFFMHHELNFVSCIEYSILERFIHHEDYKTRGMKLFKIIALTVPSLLMKLTSRVAYARDIASQAISVAGKLIENNNDMIILLIELHLFLVSSYLQKNRQSEEDFLALEELNTAKKLNDTQTDNYSRIRLAIDISYITAFYYYKSIKKAIKMPHNKNLDKQVLYDKINSLLNDAEANIKFIGADYNVAKGKIILLRIKTGLVIKGQIDKPNFAKLKEAISYFDSSNSQLLNMISNYLYAKLALKYFKSIVNHSSPPPNLACQRIANTTENLIHAKNHYLVRRALHIAKMIKDTSMETKIKILIDEINLQIRIEHYNVFILMRAAPIVETKSKTDIDPENISSLPKLMEDRPRAIGDPTRIISSFRVDLINTLRQKEKSLFVKFDILTRETLLDSLENGCKILYLKTIGPPIDNSLIIEGPLGKLDRMTFDEIKTVFDQKLCASTPFINRSTPLRAQTQGKLNARGFSLTNINDPKICDIVILVGDNAESIASFFCDLKIMHIITFSFHTKDIRSHKEDIGKRMLINLYMDKFIEFFYDEIIDNKSVIDAFNDSKSRVMEYLSEKYYEGEDLTKISNIFNDGAILLPKDEDHTEKIFEGEFELSRGDITDISKEKFASNIKRPLLPITGRNIELYNIMKKLKQYKCIEICGQCGIGKTTIAIHLGYFLLSRHLYADGIFYIPLGQLASQDEIKDYLKYIFGPKIEYNLLGSFKDKDMLFIFDDFDHEQHNKLPFIKVLLRTIKESKVSLIIISQEKTINENMSMSMSMNLPIIKIRNKRDISKKNSIGFEKIYIHPMNNEDMIFLLLSYLDLNPFQIDKVYKLLKELAYVNQFQGNPKSMIDHHIEKTIMIGHIELKIKSDYKSKLDLGKPFRPTFMIPNLERVQSIVRESSILSNQSSFDINNSIKSLKKDPSINLSRQSQELKKVSQVFSPDKRPRPPPLLKIGEFAPNPPEKTSLSQFSSSIFDPLDKLSRETSILQPDHPNSIQSAQDKDSKSKLDQPKNEILKNIRLRLKENIEEFSQGFQTIPPNQEYDDKPDEIISVASKTTKSDGNNNTNTNDNNNHNNNSSELQSASIADSINNYITLEEPTIIHEIGDNTNSKRNGNTNNNNNAQSTNPSFSLKIIIPQTQYQ